MPAGAKNKIFAAPLLARKKAELISAAWIYVPPGIAFTYPLSKSTAGPGTGREAAFFGFGTGSKCYRVRLNITKDSKSTFSLAESRGGREGGDDIYYEILKRGRKFLHIVSILPKIYHSPTHAFINIDSRCAFGCSFCASPRLHGREKKSKLILEMVENARRMGATSVALTSGVVRSPAHTANVMVRTIKNIRKRFPEMAIGVEPYLDSTADIRKLKNAGAGEIKLNIQSYDRKIFEKVCPNLDFDIIMRNISAAGKIFGKGKVASNIIIGLGENDRNVLAGVECLARFGAVATIRAVGLGDENARELEKALGHPVKNVGPARLIRLAIGQKDILKKHGLGTSGFRTMCHNCASCDIMPFSDL